MIGRIGGGQLPPVVLPFRLSEPTRFKPAKILLSRDTSARFIRTGITTAKKSSTVFLPSFLDRYPDIGLYLPLDRYNSSE